MKTYISCATRLRTRCRRVPYNRVLLMVIVFYELVATMPSTQLLTIKSTESCDYDYTRNYLGHPSVLPIIHQSLMLSFTEQGQRHAAHSRRLHAIGLQWWRLILLVDWVDNSLLIMLCKEKLTHFQLSPEVFYNVLSIRAEQAMRCFS